MNQDSSMIIHQLNHIHVHFKFHVNTVNSGQSFDPEVTNRTNDISGRGGRLWRPSCDVICRQSGLVTMTPSDSYHGYTLLLCLHIVTFTKHCCCFLSIVTIQCCHYNICYNDTHCYYDTTLLPLQYLLPWHYTITMTTHCYLLLSQQHAVIMKTNHYNICNHDSKLLPWQQTVTMTTQPVLTVILTIF